MWIEKSISAIISMLIELAFVTKLLSKVQMAWYDKSDAVGDFWKHHNFIRWVHE